MKGQRSPTVGQATKRGPIVGQATKRSPVVEQAKKSRQQKGGILLK